MQSLRRATPTSPADTPIDVRTPAIVLGRSIRRGRAISESGQDFSLLGWREHELVRGGVDREADVIGQPDHYLGVAAVLREAAIRPGAPFSSPSPEGSALRGAFR
jgi:hypothetical protein